MNPIEPDSPLQSYAGEGWIDHMLLIGNKIPLAQGPAMPATGSEWRSRSSRRKATILWVENGIVGYNFCEGQEALTLSIASFHKCYFQIS